MLELQPVRRALADALADLIVCECVSVAATRSLHVTPEQASVNSAMAKYFVPTLTESALQSLSVTLGARYYLRQEHVHGIFQKMLRDNAVIGLFDGSTAINLTLMAQQLPLLFAEDSADRGPEARERNRVCLRLSESLPPFDATRLALDNLGRSDGLDALHPGIVAETRAAGGPYAEGIAEAAGGILAWRTGLRERVLRHSAELGSEFSRSEVGFELAREYSALHAAATCFWFFAVNRDVSEVAVRADVTLLALQRLLRRHGRPVPPGNPSADVIDWLLETHRENHLFSTLRIPLGSRST
jgi:hypothetical protein